MEIALYADERGISAHLSDMQAGFPRDGALCRPKPPLHDRRSVAFHRQRLLKATIALLSHPPLRSPAI